MKFQCNIYDKILSTRNVEMFTNHCEIFRLPTQTYCWKRKENIDIIIPVLCDEVNGGTGTLRNTNHDTVALSSQYEQRVFAVSP